MIEARALVSINFLNLSENYDFMSRWLGVYDKYAKLLKGSSDAVVKMDLERYLNQQTIKWI